MEVSKGSTVLNNGKDNNTLFTATSKVFTVQGHRKRWTGFDTAIT